MLSSRLCVFALACVILPRSLWADTQTVPARPVITLDLPAVEYYSYRVTRSTNASDSKAAHTASGQSTASWRTGGSPELAVTWDSWRVAMLFTETAPLRAMTVGRYWQPGLDAGLYLRVVDGTDKEDKMFSEQTTDTKTRDVTVGPYVRMNSSGNERLGWESRGRLYYTIYDKSDSSASTSGVDEPTREKTRMHYAAEVSCDMTWRLADGLWLLSGIDYYYRVAAYDEHVETVSNGTRTKRDYVIDNSRKTFSANVATLRIEM